MSRQRTLGAAALTAAVFVVLFGVAAKKPNAKSAKPPSPIELVLRALPEKLRRLRPGVSTAAGVRVALGRPGSQRGASEFREIDGVRFDTTVTYRGGKVESIWHATGRAQVLFRDIEPLLTEAQREDLDAESREAGPGDQSGRYLTVRWREAGVTARFLNTEQAPLSVIFVESAVRNVLKGR